MVSAPIHGNLHHPWIASPLVGETSDEMNRMTPWVFLPSIDIRSIHPLIVDIHEGNAAFTNCKSTDPSDLAFRI